MQVSRVPRAVGSLSILALLASGCTSAADRPRAESSGPEAAPVLAAGEAPPRAPGATAAVQVASLEHGRTLYGGYCAVCHGDGGAGDGPAAYLLAPAPRDFTQARFRLVSTHNGAPTDADLIDTLRRGMPGSSMPAWEWMSDVDLASLAMWVRSLALNGKIARLLAQAEVDEETLTREEARAIAQRGLTPGPALQVPADYARDPARLALGKRVFDESCALCHGVDGRARDVKEQFNEDGTPTRPRDLTLGMLKGGAGSADLARRVLAGMPGSPMPAGTFKDAGEVAAVVAYVETLLAPGAAERGVQTRTHLQARRVRNLPQRADDPAWIGPETVDLPLMQLWWRESRVDEVQFAAVHDGRTLAVRLRWNDRTKDEEALGQDSFSDGAALQFARFAADGTPPPLFAMGEPGKSVSLWHWKAAWELDRSQARDMFARYPFTLPDQFGEPDAPSAPLYVTGRAAGNPVSSPSRPSAAEALQAQGLGTLDGRAAPAGVEARGQWIEGRWNVVFRRPLADASAGGLPLEAGVSVHCAMAVWDGAALDRDGQKAVTVWHVLELDP